jgi:hypothetical protein
MSDWGCSKKSPYFVLPSVLFIVLPSPHFLSCRSAPLLSCRALARHPSLRSGRRPGMSFRGMQVPRDPSLRSGWHKKGARGDIKRVLGATKKDASGRQQKGLHKLLKQTHVRLAHLFEFNNIIRNKWHRIGLKNFRVSNKNKDYGGK